MVTSKLFVAFFVASPLGLSAADETVALLGQVEGNVLLSTGSEMASAAGPIRLVSGIRVLPSWRSSAVVLFDDGCRVEVGAGERFVVERHSPCRGVAAKNPDLKDREAGR
jgi:hypothetical protein